MAGTSTTTDLALACVVLYLYGGTDALLGLDDLGKNCFRYLLDIPELDLQEILTAFNSGNQPLADARAYCGIHKQVTYKQRQLFRSGEQTYRSPRWIAGVGA
jgi:hypothetical protein